MPLILSQCIKWKEHPSPSGSLPQPSSTSQGQEGVGDGEGILGLCLQFPAQLHRDGDAQKMQVSKTKGAVGQKATCRSVVPTVDQDLASQQLSLTNVLGLP